MSNPSRPPSSSAFVPACTQTALEEQPSADEGSAIDRLLERIETPPEPEPGPRSRREPEPDAHATPEPEPEPQPIASAEPPRLVLVRGLERAGANGLKVRLRAGGDVLSAELLAELDEKLVNQALRDGQLFLAEWSAGTPPLVVGVVQTRQPSSLELTAESISLDAANELLLRSGGAAIRLRSGGELELVGSHISAMSRGLMRLVGRLLRLN